MPYRFAATSDIGAEREKMEDYMAYSDLDGKSENLFCVIADGTTSREGYFQPAQMVVTDIINGVNRLYSEKPEIFRSDPLFCLKTVLSDANKYLGLLQIANEEVFSGYAASVTCCYFDENRRIFGAHAGNTRLYIVRDGKLNQITHDHTVAAMLVSEGKMDLESYYLSSQRLQMTSGIGLVTDPEIQVFKGKLKENDIILMTTDGIHYALRPEPMAELLLKAGEPLASTEALVHGARYEVQYADNMAAMIIDF